MLDPELMADNNGPSIGSPSWLIITRCEHPADCRVNSQHVEGIPAYDRSRITLLGTPFFKIGTVVAPSEDSGKRVRIPLDGLNHGEIQWPTVTVCIRKIRAHCDARQPPWIGHGKALQQERIHQCKDRRIRAYAECQR